VPAKGALRSQLLHKIMYITNLRAKLKQAGLGARSGFPLLDLTPLVAVLRIEHSAPTLEMNDLLTKICL
jgi:hypothetical protein